MKLEVTIVLSLLSAASAGVVSLTPANFATETAGKSVFIKFFAPWCGHCKSMAADWETLAEDFASAADSLIAEVDCTLDENEGICSENGVQGFPTLKYGNPSALDDYQGGRDYDSLKSFADENLKPTCSPFNLELCEGEEKTEIESYFAMPDSDLQAQVDAVDAIVKNAEDEFETSLEKLQQTYESMMEAHEQKLEDEKKNSNYKVIKAVLGFKKSQEKQMDEL